MVIVILKFPMGDWKILWFTLGVAAGSEIITHTAINNTD
jgi:hypothetical protein